jgi:hypothetical protein
MHAFDAVRSKQFQLLPQRGEPRRRRLRREQLERMGFEGEHAGRQTERVRLVLEAREHRLVAPVHAIEIADGKRCRRPAAFGNGAANPHVQDQI